MAKYEIVTIGDGRGVSKEVRIETDQGQVVVKTRNVGGVVIPETIEVEGKGVPKKIATFKPDPRGSKTPDYFLTSGGQVMMEQYGDNLGEAVARRLLPGDESLASAPNIVPRAVKNFISSVLD